MVGPVVLKFKVFELPFPSPEFLGIGLCCQLSSRDSPRPSRDTQRRHLSLFLLRFLFKLIGDLEPHLHTATFAARDVVEDDFLLDPVQLLGRQVTPRLRLELESVHLL
jgi:hypothetical protein